MYLIDFTIDKSQQKYISYRYLLLPFSKLNRGICNSPSLITCLSSLLYLESNFLANNFLLNRQYFKWCKSKFAGQFPFSYFHLINLKLSLQIKSFLILLVTIVLIYISSGANVYFSRLSNLLSCGVGVNILCTQSSVIENHCEPIVI